MDQMTDPDFSTLKPRMSVDEIEFLLLCLLRNPVLFSEARQILTASHFSPYESIYRVLWESCVSLYDQYGNLPSREVLEVEALARAGELLSELPVDGLEEIRKYVVYAWELPDSKVLVGDWVQYSFDLLQKFLKERHWMDNLRNVVTSWGGSVPLDAPEFLKESQKRYAAVQSISLKTVESLMANDDDESSESFKTISTGCDFLDKPMGGGWVEGEVYGLLGVHGSGKTMMGCQLAAEAAVQLYARSVAQNQPPKQVLYFTYETPPADIRKRMVSYLAEIKLLNLNEKPYRTTLSRTGNRKEYEEQMFGSSQLGEWERYQSIRHLDPLIGVANMTGPKENPKAGSGFVEEIHAEIEKWRYRNGLEVGMVVIDYALICTHRYIKAQGWDPDRKVRHLLGGFGDDCRRLISQHFNCGVWVLNQLSGASNKKAPGARMTAADSAEATNFAENLWYAFCLGKKDRNNMVSMDVSKCRRSEGTSDPIILHLRGDMARFASADDRYMVDPNTRRIVPRSTGDIVAPASAASQRRPRPATDFE